MNKDSLYDITRLVNKTGDRCIVCEEGQPSLVIMSFEDYEHMIDNSFLGEKDFEEPVDFSEDFSREEAPPNSEEAFLGQDSESLDFTSEEKTKSEEPLYYFGEEK
ncbi:hypothetical protein KKC60_04280 [Patescibacteria group bacterium]|nr:hypothetical protein [Patescibacteria group bacterium]